MNFVSSRAIRIHRVFRSQRMYPPIRGRVNSVRHGLDTRACVRLVGPAFTGKKISQRLAPEK